jgi:hypothetical protein
MDASQRSRTADAQRGEGDLGAWDERILALVPSGIDVTLIEENLKLTPTERLEKLSAFIEFIEGARSR